MDSEQERLERDIMRQRMRVGDDVDALVEKVSPGQAARRQVGRVTGAVTSVRDRVMGQAGGGADATKAKAADLTHATRDRAVDAGNGIADTAEGAKDALVDAKDSAAGAVSSAAGAARRRTGGNPLAAGLVAFGVGWLVSSLIPASKAEERAGVALRDRAQEPARKLGAQLGEKAKEVGEHLREPAQEAAESVKQTASDAAAHVKERASGHADHLTEEARDRAGSVRDNS